MLLVLASGVGRSEVGGPASREASRTRGLGLGPASGCGLGVGPQRWLCALCLEALGDCVALEPWERSRFLGYGCSQVKSGCEPWEVAILGGPGWDEQAIQGEARVFFQGCVCLCVGKRDWVREWGR